MFDYHAVNGKKKVKTENPEVEHIALGVPDQKMQTCDRIMIENGPVFRGSGLYVFDGNVGQLGVLIYTYKVNFGSCYAVIEKLPRVLKRSKEYLVVSKF